MKVIRRYDELDGFKKALKTDFLSQLLASSSGKNVQFSDFIFFSLWANWCEVRGASWNKPTYCLHQSWFSDIRIKIWGNLEGSYILVCKNTYNEVNLVTVVPTVPCLCQTCPQFLILSGFQNWTGCLRTRAGLAGPWALRYRGWGLRPPSCWVNRWGPREMRRCSWSHWGDSLSSDLDTWGQIESKKTFSRCNMKG